MPFLFLNVTVFLVAALPLVCQMLCRSCFSHFGFAFFLFFARFCPKRETSQTDDHADPAHDIIETRAPFGGFISFDQRAHLARNRRIDKALDKCLGKLNESQQKDGSWNVGGGWASVLQSSLGCSALEYAQAAGKQVDEKRLDSARKYQLGNFDASTGATKTEAAAGVSLYAFNGSLRGNAAQANTVRRSSPRPVSIA